MKTPKPNQVCLVEWEPKGGMAPTERQYAIWNTGYSIYGAGGHFTLGDGKPLGLPCDVLRWWGTHWIATETPDIACSGQDQWEWQRVERSDLPGHTIKRETLDAIVQAYEAGRRDAATET